MYRFIIGICILFSVTAWSFFPRNRLNLNNIALNELMPAQLSQALRNNHGRYLKADKKSKPYMAITVGYLHYLNEDFESARKYYTEALDNKKFDFRDYALFYLGKMAIEEKKCSQAALHRKMLNAKYADTAATKKINFLWKTDCTPKSVTKPKSRIARLKKYKRDLYEAAVESFEAKNYKRAIFQFKKYLDRVKPGHPHVADAMVKLSIIYKRLRWHKERLRVLKSLSRFKKAHKKFPYNPKWIYELARYYWNREQKSLAKKQLYRLVYWPYHRYVGRSYYILARIAAEDKKYRTALKYLTKSTEYIVLPDQQEEIAYLIGWYAYKIKDYKKTMESFKYFRSTFPESAYFMRVSYWLGRAYLNANQDENANKVFKEVSNKNPYSYYGIRSMYRMKEPRKQLAFGKELAFNFDKKIYKEIKQDAFKKAETLIQLRLGEDAVNELNYSVPRRLLAKLPWDFQYYTAALYSLGGDHLKAFIILNELQKTELKKLPPDHMSILYPKRYWQLITKYAKRFNIDPYLVISIMRQESVFDTEAISPADAYGLLQMTPYMGRAMGKQLGIPLKHKDDLLKPEVNLLYCTYYIAQLLKKYKGNLILTLATYNANDRAVRKWLKRYWVNDHEEFIEEIPYQETRNYVKLILRNYTNYLYVHERQFRVYPEAYLSKWELPSFMSARK